MPGGSCPKGNGYRQQLQLTLSKTETTATSLGPVRHITPILIKEEPSEIHITKIVNAYKSELPDIPDHLFIKNQMENQMILQSPILNMRLNTVTM